MIPIEKHAVCLYLPALTVADAMDATSTYADEAGLLDTDMERLTDDDFFAVYDIFVRSDAARTLFTAAQITETFTDALKDYKHAAWMKSEVLAALSRIRFAFSALALPNDQLLEGPW